MDVNVRTQLLRPQGPIPDTPTSAASIFAIGPRQGVAAAGLLRVHCSHQGVYCASDAPWEFSLHLLVTTPSPLPEEVPFTCFLWPSVAADQQPPHFSGSSTTTEGLGFLHAYI